MTNGHAAHDALPLMHSYSELFLSELYCALSHDSHAWEFGSWGISTFSLYLKKVGRHVIRGDECITIHIWNVTVVQP